MLLAALRDAFVLDAAIRERVGQRVYRDRAPAGEPLPVIVLTATSTLHEYDLEREVGALETRVQVDVYSTLATERDAVAESIRKLLSSARGQVGSSAHQVRILGATIDRDEQTSEPPADASDTWIFRSSVDYRVTWERP